MTLFSRFQEQLKQNQLISKSDRILVAFSGGKDSVCLLLLLLEMRKHFPFQIGACHVHHGIRGTEADEDLCFCEEFCHLYQIPFYARSCDAPKFSKDQRLCLEEGARILRYQALQTVADKKGYNKIATAHTASDQAETVLFHLIRGSGLQGLRGIPSKRNNIIRPLLPFYKEEILDYLKNRHIEFREDSTNADTLYTRNRLRIKILPEMKNINPATERSLVRFSQVADEQCSLICSVCDQWEKDNQTDPESSKVRLQALLDLYHKKEMRPIVREEISRMARKEEIVIDFQHFKAMEALLNFPSEGKLIQISNGFSFQIKDGFLHFGRNEIKSEGIEYQVNLHVGENALPISDIVIKLSDKRRGKVININKKLLIIHAAFDKIEGSLFARNRKDGDRVVIGGMTRSLKKLFQDAKVPSHRRDRIPIICDQKGIVWIPYVGLCDRVRESNCDEIFTMEILGMDLPHI